MRFFANELRFYDKNQANGIAIEKKLLSSYPCMAMKSPLSCPNSVLITMKLHYKKLPPRRTLQSIDNQNDTNCDLKA